MSRKMIPDNNRIAFRFYVYRISIELIYFQTHISNDFVIFQIYKRLEIRMSSLNRAVENPNLRFLTTSSDGDVAVQKSQHVYSRQI